jgi:hypothetical protein
MDYQIENLGDERFQEMCQALLAREFPEIQCFPVGQPDGGRDAAFWLYQGGKEKGFAVFQVKYTRRPLAEKEPHKWLTEVLDAEAPKIKALIPKGAKSYYLLTNIPGTAHLQAGSIDRCNKLLSETLSIPARCWWRDDINRRLDDAFNLKWAYPEILSGPDMLHLIVQTGLSEHREKRGTAIKAFVKAQSDQDATVRFKQVELQNRLLSLFIDGPVALRSAVEWRGQLYFLESLKHPQKPGAESEKIGGATLLLDSRVDHAFPMIVLEGAPGQGKSTLGQYVCQVHRMRLLQDTDALNSVPDHHRPRSVKIPFRVDLRDLATWFGRKDPFSADETDAVPLQWHKSLEAFLAAQVRHYSGGADFSVVDLHAVAKLSAVLLVLDGLDEVAELTKRKEVVDEIITGVGRLKALAASLQVVITSRPSVFGQALGFPEKQFPHFQLTDLPRDHIFAYCEKWLAGRAIAGREAADVRRILKLKIEQPHIRDLSRNPMQLTILLSLIHTQGSSLPDKRTALYDNYVDLFLNREAEKTAVVRENRQLLVNLHRHLAWILHCESHKSTLRGSISHERLLELIKDYLEGEDLDVSSLSPLFSGMVDRIVFLVSRVQGTYEFEVQPLREYFAARHLYETAPYSPTGCPRKGTKPDRFDALAQSSYWLNVARFFAGCFSKGELPCLIDRLQELTQKGDFRLTSQPRRLATALLSDYVFSQDKRSTREAVGIILEGVSFCHPLQRRHSRQRYGSEGSPTLPPECGGEELVAKAMESLSASLAADYAAELTELLTANELPERLDAFWRQKMQTATEKTTTAWLQYGLWLGSLPRCPQDSFAEIFDGKKLDAERIRLLLFSNHASYLQDSEDRSKLAIECILDGLDTIRPDDRDLLPAFAIALQPHFYSIAFDSPTPTELSRLRKQCWGSREEAVAQKRNVKSKPYLAKCVEFSALVDSESERSCAEWASSIEPWDRIVELSRSLFGEAWQNSILATAAAGIRSSDEKCKEFHDLFDHSKSLCRRTRYARLRAGNHQWWQKQLELARTFKERLYGALVFFAWASAETILQLKDLAEVLLDELGPEQWGKLMKRIQSISISSRLRARGTLLGQDLPSKMSERLCVALGSRMKPDAAEEIYRRYLTSYSGKNPTMLAFCEGSALQLAHDHPDYWPQALALVLRKYKLRLSNDEYFWMARGEFLPDGLPSEVAQQIASEPRKYPRFLVYLAEGRCQLDVETKLPSIADVAEADGWFARPLSSRL